jgi:hypothetical protein
MLPEPRTQQQRKQDALRRREVNEPKDRELMLGGGWVVPD